MELLAQIEQCDLLVLGSPVYWYHLSGGLRVVLDRFYGPVEPGSLAGKELYLIYQGAAPEPWMLDAGIYTIRRFASLYGMDYKGCASCQNDLPVLKAELNK